MAQKTFHYPKDDVTVVWKPELCQHSGICFRGLPRVFDPRRRPWIDTAQGEKEVIIAQVNQCPSGALSMRFGPADPEGDTGGIAPGPGA